MAFFIALLVFGVVVGNTNHVCQNNLTSLLRCRLFNNTHDDFKCRVTHNNAKKDIIASSLAENCRPILNESYQLPDAVNCLSSSASFSNWFNRTSDEASAMNNISLSHYKGDVYPGPSQGRQANPFYVCEAHACFVARKGDSMDIATNNEVWLYVNGTLALDLGGIHSGLNETLGFDQLNLVPDQSYRIDLLLAQRNSNTSHLNIHSTLCLFECNDECGTLSPVAKEVTVIPTARPTPRPTSNPTSSPTPCPSQPRCGDNVIDANEVCDNGTANNNVYGECMENCQLPVCGDGVIHLCSSTICVGDEECAAIGCYVEECDDSNIISGDGCSAECMYEYTAHRNSTSNPPNHQ